MPMHLLLSPLLAVCVRQLRPSVSTTASVESSDFSQQAAYFLGDGENSTMCNFESIYTPALHISGGVIGGQWEK
jgi:hypothetical protein